jgi:hypothetical protein
MNDIFLRRRNKLIVNRKKGGKNSIRVMATLLKNFSSLGYTFSKDIIDRLKVYPEKSLEKFEKNTSKVIKEMLGADVEYNPMYPNFPKQVMEASDAELFFNAALHYITTIRLEGKVDSWLPTYEKEEREKLVDIPKLQVIELGSKEEFFGIFKNMIGAKVEMSPTDKTDLDWFVKQFKDDIKEILPDKIENKENLSYTIGELRANSLDVTDLMGKYFKTATDVLRMITAFSDGDVSLSSNTKFKSFPRKDRRMFLELLEKSNSLEEDMKRNINRWIRIGEILHPTEYKKQYPKTADAFHKLRNGLFIPTYAGKCNWLIETKRESDLIKLLKHRPGEFARKLDWVLREFDGSRDITDAFNEVSDKVSPKVLLQVREHFKTRNEKPYRAFIPKGTLSKLQLTENKLEKIKTNACLRVMESCEKGLVKQFKNKEKLGKVFIDKDLKNYPIPFAMRSASKAYKTVARGSRVELDNKPTIRMFIYWKEDGSTGRVDIDLSCAVYDEEWNLKEQVSFTHLRTSKFRGYHSGDITSAPNGASEFIDFDKKSVLANGGRYLVMNVNSFTGQFYSTLPICYAGCMTRQAPQSGEIYEPTTVKTKFDLTSETKVCVPLIFDLVENQFIWTDIGMGASYTRRCATVEGNQTGLIAIGKALTTLSKPNLYDLFRLNAKARGEIVEDKEDADLIFSTDEGIKPTDIDVITSEYL